MKTIAQIREGLALLAWFGILVFGLRELWHGAIEALTYQRGFFYEAIQWLNRFLARIFNTGTFDDPLVLFWLGAWLVLMGVVAVSLCSVLVSILLRGSGPHLAGTKEKSMVGILVRCGRQCCVPQCCRLDAKRTGNSRAGSTEPSQQH